MLKIKTQQPFQQSQQTNCQFDNSAPFGTTIDEQGYQ
jgi:hypothetical protein